jgi:recombination protein RecA
MGKRSRRAGTLEDVLSKVRADTGQVIGTARGQLAVDQPEVEILECDTLALNSILGHKGLPRGRVVEVFGAEAGGKTTLTLHIIAAAQKRGHIAAFIDAEHALDPTYATALGVDMEKLILYQPDSGEDALTMAESLVSTGDVALVVIDSVSALVPQAELDGEMGDSHPGLQARLMSQALRKLTGKIASTKAIVIFINQLRMKIGVSYGSPKTTSGGRALRFYASVRIEVTRIGSLKRGEIAYGNRVKMVCVKNKVASPFLSTEVDLIFGKGMCREAQIMNAALAHGIVTRAGAWYSYGDVRVQGLQKLLTFLEENPKVTDEILAKL